MYFFENVEQDSDSTLISSIINVLIYDLNCPNATRTKRNTFLGVENAALMCL